MKKMREYRINLIDGIKPQEGIEISRSEKAKKRIPIFFRIGIFILVIVLFYLSQTIFLEESVLTQLGRLSFWEGVARFIFQQDKILKGELTDRINFLILGMGGAEHEGPYLTDTIILASIKPSQKTAALISIPRDLYVFSEDFGWQKINALNALGMTKKSDGLLTCKKTVEKIFEIPIHYWLRIDFKGLKEIVDSLSGLEIYVERSFTDYSYPVPGFKYQTISFEKGLQVFNGERVLQFVRSRHGTNGEDSDFARMKRQQKVILALKEKFEEQEILSAPAKIFNLCDIYIQNVTTNLELSEIIKLGKLLRGIPQENIITRSFEIGPSGELVSEIISNGAYVLKPKTGDFREMANLVKNIFNQKAELSKQSPAKVIVLNGTFISGLAKGRADLLAQDFEVVEIGNAQERNIKKTIIYDLTKGAKGKELKILSEKLKAEIGTEIPNYFQNKNVDFVVVLGEE